MILFRVGVLALALASLVAAAPIFTLVSTGLGVSGAADASWQVNGGTVYKTAPATIGTPGFPFGAWSANTASSGWVSPQPVYNSLGGDAPGNYTYTTTFDLSGMDASSAWFRYRLAGDNTVVSVSLNSTAIGGAGYNGMVLSSVYEANNGFLPGMNTITVVVNNTNHGVGVPGNPTGFRFEVVDSEVEAQIGEIPEPATFALVGLALFALPLVRRKRS